MIWHNIKVVRDIVLHLICTRENYPYSHPRNARELTVKTIATIVCHFSSKKIGLLNKWHFMKLDDLPADVKALVGRKDGSSSSRIHLTWFRRLNEFLSLDFGYRTDSYVLTQYVSKIYIQLIRSTYVLNNNKYLRTYFMIILPGRKCTWEWQNCQVFSAHWNFENLQKVQ